MTAARPRRPRRSAPAEREVRRDSPLRRARTCYDHLAGVAGVGVDLIAAAAAAAAARPFARPCLDWTERRSHLAGGLGAAVLRRLAQDGIVRRTARSRVVVVRRPLAEWLGA